MLTQEERNNVWRLGQIAMNIFLLVMVLFMLVVMSGCTINGGTEINFYNTVDGSGSVKQEMLAEGNKVKKTNDQDSQQDIDPSEITEGITNGVLHEVL